MTLHDDLLAAVTARQERARAATPGPWTARPFVYGRPEDGWGEPSNFEIFAEADCIVGHQPHEGGGVYSRADAEHIAAEDPAAVLRHCERDLKVLERHQWMGNGACDGCYPKDDQGWPCDEIRDLAEAYGLEAS